MLARRRTPRPFDFRRRLRRCELVEQVGRVGDRQADFVDAELEEPLARGADIICARPYARGDLGVANCAAHAPRAGSSAPLRRSSFASVSAGIITSSNVAATPCAETGLRRGQVLN